MISEGMLVIFTALAYGRAALIGFLCGALLAIADRQHRDALKLALDAALGMAGLTIFSLLTLPYGTHVINKGPSQTALIASSIVPVILFNAVRAARGRKR